MDPDETYRAMYFAMCEKKFQDARDNAMALKGWLSAGGFYPQNSTKVEVDSYLSSVLRRTRCICSESAA
jgi:hypothetical protein